MRQKKLRDAIIKAYDLHHQADSAVSVVASLFSFRDFEYDDVPIVSITSSGEMILYWHEYSLFVESAIEIMEKVGYIHPSDFDPLYEMW